MSSDAAHRPSTFVAEALEPRRFFDAGLLDVQFNPVGGGAAVTNFRNANENGRAVLPMADGRVIVVGEYEGTERTALTDWGGFALVRHNADGSYDPSFGPGGSVRVRGPAGQVPQVTDAVLQPDGKILVLASFHTQAPFAFGTMLARFNESGTLDTTFGTGGIVQTTRVIVHDDGGGLAVLPSGKILLAGTLFDATAGNQLGLARLNVNGTFDTSFANQGLATATTGAGSFSVTALLPTSDGGAIIVARGGSQFEQAALAKLTAAGAPASGFGTAGVSIFDNAFTEAVNGTLAADGGIVLVGSGPGNTFRVSKFSATTGQRVNSFGAAADGTADGKIDIAFNGQAEATSVVLQSDTKLVVGGWRQRSGSRAMALTRLNADGSIDGTWGEFGRTATNVSAHAFDEIFDVAIGADGSIYAGGSSADNLGGRSMAAARFWRAEAPSAMMGPRRISRAGAIGYTFTVVYRDDAQVNAESLNNPDIEITGPNGAFYRTRLLGSVAEVGGAVRYANYNLAAPGGTFGAEDNGIYTVRLRSNQIGDTEGNLTMGRVLGTITVNIPVPLVPQQQFSGTRIRSNVAEAEEGLSQREEELVSLGGRESPGLRCATPRGVAQRGPGDSFVIARRQLCRPGNPRSPGARRRSGRACPSARRTPPRRRVACRLRRRNRTARSPARRAGL